MRDRDYTGLPAGPTFHALRHSLLLLLANDPLVHVQAELGDAEHALMAEAVSPYGARVLEMDLSLQLGLLVCGDRWGNIAAFSIPDQALSLKGGVDLPL